MTFPATALRPDERASARQTGTPQPTLKNSAEDHPSVPDKGEAPPNEPAHGSSTAPRKIKPLPFRGGVGVGRFHRRRARGNTPPPARFPCNGLPDHQGPAGA